MAELKNRLRFTIMAVIGLFILFIFYALNLRDKAHANAFERSVLSMAAPIHELTADGNRFVATTWNDYVYLVGLRKENKKLLDVATSQHTRIIAGEEALLENQRLQKLLELKGAMADRSLVAHVIGEDSAPWFKSIIIDRGADDGLREGMPVVATSGVVGQIVKVTGSKSRVLLLTDNASAIAGTVQRSRARGVVKGKGGGLCTLEFALREEDVQVGDVIITSGMGGVFPKGLPLGEVTMVKKGEYRIFQSVEVRPAVNLPRLEEVVVLLRQQTQEPL